MWKLMRRKNLFTSLLPFLQCLFGKENVVLKKTSMHCILLCSQSMIKSISQQHSYSKGVLFWRDTEASQWPLILHFSSFPIYFLTQREIAKFSLLFFFFLNIWATVQLLQPVINHKLQLLTLRSLQFLAEKLYKYFSLPLVFSCVLLNSNGMPC